MGVHSSEEGEGSGEDLDARIRQVKELYDRFGRDDERTSNQLQVEVNMCLFDAIKAFVAGYFDSNQERLEALHKSVVQFASRSAVGHFLFSINRVRAVGYYLQARLDLCVKHLNTCVSECPRGNGNQAPGLADVLMLLSEVYYSLGYNDEAFHSAKLCVDVALSRLGNFEKQSASGATNQNNWGSAGMISGATRESFIDRTVGPALDEYTAMTAAYQTLGGQLHAQGNFSLAVEWLRRALSTAAKFGLDYQYRAELQAQLEESNAAMANDFSDKVNDSDTSKGRGVVEEKRERRTTSRPRSAMPQKTPSSSAQRECDRRGLTENVDDNLDFENTSGDGAHNSGSSDSHSPEKIDRNDGPYVNSTASGMEVQDASRNRPKSAIGKLGGGYGPKSMRMKPASNTRTSDEDDNEQHGLGIVAGGWEDVSREMLRQSRPNSRDRVANNGGVVAMLPPSSADISARGSRREDKKVSKGMGNQAKASGAGMQRNSNRSMSNFGGADVDLLHNDSNDDGFHDPELDVLLKVSGEAFSPALQSLRYQQQQQPGLFVDGLQSSAGFAPAHSSFPGSPRYKLLLRLLSMACLQAKTKICCV